MSLERDSQEVALIGMAGRFPGARDVAAYWSNLLGGVESIRPVEGGTGALDPHFVRAAAVLDDLDRFDATFFGYTPREAELMDPQHRIFLELCWEALEDAGYGDPADRAAEGAVGVFAGAATNTYLPFNLLSRPDVLAALDLVQIDIANGADFLATRVAYKLNLRGPAFTVASACSTSLVATHIACQSLLDGECDLALAGGATIHVKHPQGYRYLPGGIVSPDGHCRAFDARAQGTVFGSGAGVVVLKRLAEAIEDGDFIYAVIKGSAVNNDGARKVGYTAPGVDGQAAVIREALAAAGVPPDSIGYVETHGTGTAMGDPIEVRALARALRPRGTQAAGQRAPIPIGSVKTNIGHLATAAGVASLIKAALALRHRQIPPSLHFTQPNPEIDWAASRLYVNTTTSSWSAGPWPRRAGVSSFGVGGTNAHVVLEEAPGIASRSAAVPGPQLLLLSAKTAPALELAAARLRHWLVAHPELELADVAHTLQEGREAMSHRRALVCCDRDDALRQLDGATAAGAASDHPALGAAAARFVAGLEVDWAALRERRPRRRVPLPGYPFARDRYWIDPPPTSGLGSGPIVRPPLPTGSALPPDLPSTVAAAASAKPAEGPAPAAAPARTLHSRPALATPYVAPRTELERALALLWQEVLGLAPVGIDDNFFDLGGSSLLAVQAAPALQRLLGAAVEAAALYQHPTVRTLATLAPVGDGDPAARERAERLARRTEELARRNQLLRGRGR